MFGGVQEGLAGLVMRKKFCVILSTDAVKLLPTQLVALGALPYWDMLAWPVPRSWNQS